jgi:hypothetical protein
MVLDLAPSILELFYRFLWMLILLVQNERDWVIINCTALIVLFLMSIGSFSFEI